VSFPKFLDAAPPAKGLDRITWPAANVPARQLGRLGLDSIVVATDGSQSAVEQARTAPEIANGCPGRNPPLTLGETAARLAMLRRVVALEGAVPLLAVAAVSIGVGFATCAMFATIQLEHPLVAPGAEYYLLTAAGIAASLGIIAATFPLLRRITGPDVARNE